MSVNFHTACSHCANIGGIQRREQELKAQYPKSLEQNRLYLRKCTFPYGICSLNSFHLDVPLNICLFLFLFFSLTICLLLTASLNEPKLLGYIIYCLAKLIKRIINEEYFVQNQRKNDVKGVFIVKTVRYIYFLAI